MPLFSIGPGSSGYNFQTEFFDLSCSVLLGSAGTLYQGQAVWYDQTCVPGTKGADQVLPAPNANSCRIFGIYQGATLQGTALIASNGASQYFPIYARQKGYGLVLGQTTTSGTSAGSAAINVGSQLIGVVNTAGLYGAVSGTAAATGVNIGFALATGSASAAGSAIMAGNTAATKVINAYISV
jgi:hypothetical protein